MGCGRVMALCHTPATCRSLCSMHALHAWTERYISYISIVLRIRPTAKPSISKGSPGCTMMVG